MEPFVTRAVKPFKQEGRKNANAEQEGRKKGSQEEMQKRGG